MVLWKNYTWNLDDHQYPQDVESVAGGHNDYSGNFTILLSLLMILNQDVKIRSWKINF